MPARVLYRTNPRTKQTVMSQLKTGDYFRFVTDGSMFLRTAEGAVRLQDGGAIETSDDVVIVLTDVEVAATELFE